MTTFEQFKKMVNRELSKQCGLTMDCLADFDLYEYFDAGMSQETARQTAIEAAHDLLYEEGFPMEDMT